MRTAGALAATGLLLSIFVGAVAACSSDETAAAPAVPDAGSTPDSGGGGNDASEGGGPTKPGDPKRGSRLAPQFRTTPDGLSEFDRMIDTGLGDARCSLLLAEDGVSRCLPDDSSYLGTAAIAYSDAACTAELLVSEAACKKPAFAMRVGEGPMCTTGNSVYDVGAQHTAQIYKKTDPTTCVPVASSAKESYWIVGAKRAPTDFVKLTVRTETIGGGVGVLMADGEDGSTHPRFGLVDVARAKSCGEGKGTDGKTHCFPSSSGYVNGFVDNACAKPAAIVTPYDCDPLYIGTTARANTPANDGTEQIFELGAKQPTKDTFRMDNVTCDGPFTVSEDVYERGAEIPPAMFPELGTVALGGTRIVATHYTAAGIALPQVTGMRDLMLDVKCNWQNAADGKERCLPQGGSTRFSDDQCTVRVVQSSEGAPKYANGFAAGPGCPQPFVVYAVGAEIVPKPAKLYNDYSGGCQEGGSPGPNTVYAVGAEIPPSTFVESTRVTATK